MISNALADYWKLNVEGAAMKSRRAAYLILAAVVTLAAQCPLLVQE